MQVQSQTKSAFLGQTAASAQVNLSRSLEEVNGVMERWHAGLLARRGDGVPRSYQMPLEEITPEGVTRLAHWLVRLHACGLAPVASPPTQPPSSHSHTPPHPHPLRVHPRSLLQLPPRRCWRPNPPSPQPSALPALRPPSPRQPRPQGFPGCTYHSVPHANGAATFANQPNQTVSYHSDCARNHAAPRTHAAALAAARTRLARLARPPRATRIPPPPSRLASARDADTRSGGSPAALISLPCPAPVRLRRRGRQSHLQRR